MKRIIALILSAAMLLAGCGQVQPQPQSQAEETIPEISEPATDTGSSGSIEPQYTSLDDPQLLAHVEDLVYRDAVTALNSDEYFIENVSAVYVSKEYLDEVAFNSQSNIYFGYTLAELDDIFQGTKYIFTLSDDGTTSVESLQEIEDASTETMLKNVAIGTGVILICVTISAVSAGAGVPAVSAIFVASAKTASTFALSSAAFGGISAGIVRGIQTDDFNKAMEAAAVGASEGFKWGAISGSIAGGIEKAIVLKGATLSGLTMDEAAVIQKESGYPLSVVKQFHTFDEYTVFRQAGLKAEMVGGKLSLIRSDIDLYNVIDEYGRNNFTRLSKGLNPIDSTGNPFQWHHIGQKNDATLALLTATEHDAGALHGFKVVSEIDRPKFNAYKEILNKDLLQWLLNNSG